MKLFSLAIVVVVFCLIVVTPLFAQDLVKECQTIYESLPRKDKNVIVEDYKRFIAVAKKYLEKCSNVKGQEEFKDYLIKHLPKIEIAIRDMELYDRFNKAVPAQNWDKAFESGRQLLSFNQIALILFSSLPQSVMKLQLQIPQMTNTMMT